MKTYERLLLILLFLTMFIWIVPSVLIWVITGDTGMVAKKFTELMEKAVD